MPRLLIFFALICVALLPSPLIADDVAEEIRRIEVKSIGFIMDVPSHWELRLNERAKRFITVGETDSRGNRKSASLNILYVIPKEDRFAPMPGHKVYADIIMNQMSTKDPSMKLLDAQAIEISGYKGVMVHFESTVGDQRFKMNHYRLEHPDGKDAFIVTTGSIAGEWDEKKDVLSKLVSTIRFNVEDR